MTNIEPRYIEVAPGAHVRRIATLSVAPAKHGGLGLMWFPGLRSDMLSTKAAALADWTLARGLGMTRFDYSGHGRSSGRFEDAVIGDWLEEAEAVFMHCSQGPQILVGSSTGGHVALLLLRHLAQTRPDTAARIKGLVLVAPAWDLTEELMWKKLAPEAQSLIMTEGRYLEPSAYDPASPLVITRAFIEEGRKHLFALMARNAQPATAYFRLPVNRVVELGMQIEI
jgi:alpha-beta hydrolase superfamily lysophospholipase